MAKRTEHDFQVACFQWLALAKNQFDTPLKGYAVPNAAKRSKRAGGEMKAEGLMPGVPDICIPIPRQCRCVGRLGTACRECEGRGFFGALYIEMKVGGNKTTADQDEWIEYLRSVGNRCIVIRDDVQLFIEAVTQYMGK